MTESVIILENVTLRFPKLKGILSMIKDKITKKNTSFTALKEIDLDIKSGEVFGLIGKNGSGKSTILRVISGIYPPDEGQCKVAGKISLLQDLEQDFQVIKLALRMLYCMVVFWVIMNQKCKKNYQR